MSEVAEPDVVRLHPDELGRIGATAGAPVRVTSPRGSVTLPVTGDKAIPPDVVWMAPGAAADLIDAAGVTTVTVEVGSG
jgi:anaerobic selenocysteine-containing dehydrogenase